MKHNLTLAALLLVSPYAAHATLTAETANGNAVVYDSVLDAVWTADANLLGTLESQQGQTAVINAIIAANGGAHLVLMTTVLILYRRVILMATA